MKKNASYTIDNKKQLLFLLFYIAILLVIPVASCIKGFSQNIRYLPEIDDIPLYYGIFIDKEKTLFYKTPEGRIVEIYAKGFIDTGVIIRFYNKALTQLGWEKKSCKTKLDLCFERDTEKLFIDITKKEKETLVHFSLHPIE